MVRSAQLHCRGRGTRTGRLVTSPAQRDHSGRTFSAIAARSMTGEHAAVPEDDMVATKVAPTGNPTGRPAGRASARRTADPVVEVSTLADGVVIRLAGAFRKAEADLLRGAFLRPRPAACREVIVDAGD